MELENSRSPRETCAVVYMTLEEREILKETAQATWSHLQLVLDQDGAGGGVARASGGKTAVVQT